MVTSSFFPGAMARFADIFPDIGPAETRTVAITKESENLPAGEYAFMEFYCPRLECDCRRTTLQMVEKKDPRAVLATISYGWENEDYYTEWMSGDRESAREMAGASLDPMANLDHPYADALFDLFENVVLRDPLYIERLRRHYIMVKNAAPPASRISARQLLGLPRGSNRTPSKKRRR